MAIKRRDLNSAWERRWKNDRLNKPREKAIQINPRCLSVERAISFFKSLSKIVFKPA
jgi:hypothetical protein